MKIYQKQDVGWGTRGIRTLSPDSVREDAWRFT
jgi:hypothetical protein